MKVFITKYALTKGILEKEVETSDISDEMVVENSFNCYHKPYWYKTREEAIKHCEKMLTNKIVSLEKQIKRLEKIKF